MNRRKQSHISKISINAIILFLEERMENQLALRNTTLANMDEIERAAMAMSKSGYFQDAREQAQAITKILAGREMGFGPFASMTGIYIISGRPSIGANLMAAAVKASGRYNYRVQEMTDAACEIIFFEGGKECGRSRFTLDEARKAGTKNLDKFPRNMLFARAMSNGCRWYCPDVFLGAPTYTPEELGADVNEAGEVINAQFTQAPQTAPEPRSATPVAQDNAQAVQKLWSAQNVTLDEAQSEAGSDKLKYWDLESDMLAHRLRGIDMALAKPETTDERRAELNRKKAIIHAILEYRR
jgi:hypothetical protein